MALHENLARLRIKAGLSARELSKKAGLTESHIALIERQIATNPTQKTLEAIALALGVSVTDLIDDKDSDGPSSKQGAA